MKRKDFITQTIAGSILLTSNHIFSGCTINDIETPKWNGKRLIIIQLAGGHDGLFAYSPKNSEILKAKRPILLKKAQENGILLQNDWILNHHLKALESFIVDNEIQFLPFVGYPEPNTSHFKSEEIWETGKLPNEHKSKTGWLGDLVDQKKIDIEKNNQPIVNLHDHQTLFDKGKTSEAFVWNDNAVLNWYKNDLENIYQSDEKLSPIDLKIKNQYQKLNWVANINIDIGFTNTDFGQQLAKASSIIQNGLPFKIIHTKIGGFDTHLGETKRLPNIYSDLSNNLKTLKQNLKKSGNWENTSIFIYSEFGRTIDENKNEGTDHGHAGLSILINQKKLVLRNADFLEVNQVYPKSQIDFRDIYKLLIQNQLG